MGMSGVEAPRRYCAWLLRCWEARDRGPEPRPTWRYSLEDPHSGARRGFASFEALVAHLRAELAPGRDDPPDAAGQARQPAGQALRQEDGEGNRA
jgi:hypothetical protein